MKQRLRDLLYSLMGLLPWNRRIAGKLPQGLTYRDLHPIELARYREDRARARRALEPERYREYAVKPMYRKDGIWTGNK